MDATDRKPVARSLAAMNIGFGATDNPPTGTGTTSGQ
jgi:hypothetical protein